MNKSYVAGLDVGTTSAKVVIFDKEGNVQAEAETGYPVDHPESGWAEQNPHHIEEAAVKSMRNALTSGDIKGEELTAVGLSSAMHTLICADKKGEALSPSVIFSDGRSFSQVEQLKLSGAGDAIYQTTGTPVHPMTPFAKLLWMKETGYAPYLKAERFLSIKDWLTLRWFGRAAIDYGVASASGLFDMKEFRWDPEALRLTGVQAEQLSEPVAPTYLFQGLDDEVAAKMGVPADLPFAAGGADGALANIGIGAFEPGERALTIGTSGAIREVVASPQTSAAQATFCYAVTKDKWLVGGGTNNGGNVLDWLQEAVGARNGWDDPHRALLELAEASSAGANGLLCLPLLNGERAPYWDVRARGSYIGLSSKHGKAELIRAALEGVIYSLAHVNEALSANEASSGGIFASGGFARSPFWLQLVADIFEDTVHVPASHQSSAWGAAWFALMAVGEHDTLADIRAHIPMTASIEPQEEGRASYRAAYTTYRKLYKTMQPLMHELAAQQK
ncbi:gluconokinase [Salsuginibacillus kocurii]|uniref:gluconokinase n=1 Tax=Salsuginibacillus kocurii TaxID=427078 RepID=UPI0003682323|nr:gluconokinase [Salsuginibacillus kocurii]